MTALYWLKPVYYNWILLLACQGGRWCMVPVFVTNKLLLGETVKLLQFIFFWTQTFFLLLIFAIPSPLPLFTFFSPQCCDLGYHASLARTLRTYLSAEYNLETSRHEGLDIIENAVDNLDSRSDKHKIMDMHNQVFCPPMRFEYLPHMGDEVRGSKCRSSWKICLSRHFEECVVSSSSGVPGQRPAACPDWTPDALPPTAVSLSYAKDWEWGGEDLWWLCVWPSTTFSPTPKKMKALSHFPQSQ